MVVRAASGRHFRIKVQKGKEIEDMSMLATRTDALKIVKTRRAPMKSRL